MSNKLLIQNSRQYRIHKVMKLKVINWLQCFLETSESSKLLNLY